MTCGPVDIYWFRMAFFLSRTFDVYLFPPKGPQYRTVSRRGFAETQGCLNRSRRRGVVWTKVSKENYFSPSQRRRLHLRLCNSIIMIYKYCEYIARHLKTIASFFPRTNKYRERKRDREKQILRFSTTVKHYLICAKNKICN